MKSLKIAAASLLICGSALAQTASPAVTPTPQGTVPAINIDPNSPANPSGLDTGGTASVPDVGGSDSSDPLVVPNDPLGDNDTNNLSIDGNGGNRAISPQTLQ